MKILVINPGATSTKIAVFDGENEIFRSSVEHAAQDLAHFEHVADQMPYRKALILKALAALHREGVYPPQLWE